MTQEKVSPNKVWSYQEAVATIPLFKSHLYTLRSAYIAAKHHQLLATKLIGRARRNELQASNQYGEAANRSLETLKQAGVIIYGSAIHGVLLYPFKVATNGGNQDAYFVYFSRRTTINDFVFADHPCFVLAGRKPGKPPPSLIEAVIGVPEKWLEGPPYVY